MTRGEKFRDYWETWIARRKVNKVKKGLAKREQLRLEKMKREILQ